MGGPTASDAIKRNGIAIVVERELPIVDTNVLLRLILSDELLHSQRSIEFFAQLELGLARAQTTHTVVFEAVFVLQSFYEIPRVKIRDVLLPLLGLDNLVLPHRSLYPDVFDLYTSRRKLSFADSFHAVLARKYGTGEIISFDRGFDRIPGITRLEPPLKLNG